MSISEVVIGLIVLVLIAAWTAIPFIVLWRQATRWEKSHAYALFGLGGWLGVLAAQPLTALVDSMRLAWRLRRDREHPSDGSEQR